MEYTDFSQFHKDGMQVKNQELAPMINERISCATACLQAVPDVTYHCRNASKKPLRPHSIKDCRFPRSGARAS
jgi:hypothetical protein